MFSSITCAYELRITRFFFCSTHGEFTEILTYKTSHSEIVSRKDIFTNFEFKNITRNLQLKTGLAYYRF